MTQRRFVLVDFRYTSDPLGHVRFYEAGNSYDMPRALAHAAVKRELVAVEQPIAWTPPSILRPPEVLTESELVEAEAELKALQRHALEPSIHRYSKPSLRREAVGQGRSHQ